MPICSVPERCSRRRILSGTCSRRCVFDGEDSYPSRNDDLSRSTQSTDFLKELVPGKFRVARDQGLELVFR